MYVYTSYCTKSLTLHNKYFFAYLYSISFKVLSLKIFFLFYIFFLDPISFKQIIGKIDSIKKILYISFSPAPSNHKVIYIHIYIFFFFPINNFVAFNFWTTIGLGTPKTSRKRKKKNSA